MGYFFCTDENRIRTRNVYFINSSSYEFNHLDQCLFSVNKNQVGQKSDSIFLPPAPVTFPALLQAARDAIS